MNNTTLNLTTPRSTPHGRKRWIRMISALLSVIYLNATVLATGVYAREQPGQSSGPLSADARMVLKAYRTALNQPAVRSASQAETLRQLRTRRPIAFVNGYWVTPIDMSQIYGNSSIRGAMLAALGAHPVGSRLGNVTREDLGARFGLAYSPNQFAHMMIGDLAKDFMSMPGVRAAYSHRTDFGWLVGLFLVACGFAFGVGLGIADQYFQIPTDPHTGLPISDPKADPDGDGKTNDVDDDDDGDGWSDDQDAAPLDPNEHICFSCVGAGIPGIAFTNRLSEQTMGVVINGYRMAIQANRAGQTVALGSLPAGGGLAVRLGVAFPAEIR